jgi:hypothetical protein
MVGWRLRKANPKIESLLVLIESATISLLKARTA